MFLILLKFIKYMDQTKQIFVRASARWLTVTVCGIVVFVQSSDHELWTFVSLNLALVYLRTNRQEEFMAVLSTVEPERLSNTSYVVVVSTSVFPLSCLILVSV